MRGAGGVEHDGQLSEGLKEPGSEALSQLKIKVSVALFCFRPSFVLLLARNKHIMLISIIRGQPMREKMFRCRLLFLKQRN